jgi:hypothetical protein
MEGQGYEPYQMSHSHFTLEQVDRTMVDLMRSWVRTHPLDMGTGSNKYMVSIKDMKVGSYFDLCCKVSVPQSFCDCCIVYSLLDNCE